MENETGIKTTPRKLVEAETTILQIERQYKQDGTERLIAHLAPIVMTREEASELLKAESLYLLIEGRGGLQ